MINKEGLPTTKNDLGVDLISRAEAIRVASGYCHPSNVAKELAKLPSVTPQPCEDAVSRKKVLNQIFYSTDNSGDVVLGSELRSRIDRLPSVTPQEPRWIPVSECLPVTNDEVLVTYIVNGNAKKRYVETANCFDGEWSSVNDEYRIPNTKIEIIAWCELPKPYKAEIEPQESEE